MGKDILVVVNRKSSLPFPFLFFFFFLSFYDLTNDSMNPYFSVSGSYGNSQKGF